MPSYRFEPMERLGLLAAFVLDVLDEEFGEAELDRDDHPPRTDLYNLADAVGAFVGERRLGDRPVMGYDREADLDVALNDLVERFGDDGHVGALWRKIAPTLEAGQ